MIIKHWNREVRNKINSINGLSSFAITLMLLYFLQLNGEVQVLEEQFYKSSDKSVADILEGFFEWYGVDFDDSRYLVSNVEINRNDYKGHFDGGNFEMNKFKNQMWLVIDPFDRTNNPAKTLKKGKPEAHAYKKAMWKALSDLKEGIFIY